MGLKKVLKEQGLSEEQISKITAGMEEAKIYTTSLENADERYEKLKSKKEDAEEQLKTANTTIADLKKNNKDNETLQQTITDHEKTINTLKTDYAAKVKNMTLDNAINSLLAKNKAKHADLLSSKFDREKLIVADDGTVSGMDEQFKTIQETYKDMFEASSEGGEGVKPYTYVPKNGDGDKGSTSTSFIDVIHENQARK